MGCTNSKQAPEPSKKTNKSLPAPVPTSSATEAVKPSAAPKKDEKFVLNGHALSQPCRSLQWYIDYAGKDVDIRFVDVFAGEHKSADYLAKHPKGQVPTLEVDDEFFLSESTAILNFLSEGDELAPKNLKDKTKLNEYFGRHLAVVRKLTIDLFFHGMFGKEDKEEKVAAGIKTVQPELERFNAILGKQDYVLGDQLSLADFMFAPEVDQLKLLNLLNDFPNIVAYLERLSKNVKGYQKCWDSAEEFVAKFKASQPAVAPKKTEKFVLNGHALSQPCRSLQWYIDYTGKDVDVRFVDVFAGEHKSADYLAKHPKGQVPTLEVDDEFFLSESTAILNFLSEGDELAPKNLKDKTKLNEYFGRHLAVVRKLTIDLFFHGMFGKEDKEEKVAAGIKTVQPELERFNAILGKQDYVLGDQLSLADFMFAPEVDQLKLLNLLNDFPNIVAYLERLSKNVKGYQKCWDSAEEFVAKFKASQPAVAPKKTEKFVLNGHALSQPCRSLQWYIDYTGKDVDVRFVDVFAGEHKSADYLAKHPKGQVPTLEVDDEFFLSESTAILNFLSEGDELAPKNLKDKTKLNEYFGRHLAVVRKLTIDLFFHGMFGKEDKEEKVAAGIKTVQPELERFNAILGKQDYVLGDQLSLADFMFAPEVDQLKLLNLLNDFPNIVAYLERLSKNVKGYQKCWDSAEEFVAKFKASQ